MSTVQLWIMSPSCSTGLIHELMSRHPLAQHRKDSRAHVSPSSSTGLIHELILAILWHRTDSRAYVSPSSSTGLIHELMFRHPLAQASIIACLILCALVAASDASILDTAKAHGCGKLVTFIEDAGLSTVLTNSPGATLFAPSDAAISAIPADVYTALSTNRTLLQVFYKLTIILFHYELGVLSIEICRDSSVAAGLIIEHQEVLKFHALPGVKMSTDLQDDELLDTYASRARLRVNVYNGGKVVTAQGSVVSKANLRASNGVVHVIDKVIYPIPSLNIPLFLTFDKDLNNLGFLAYKANLITKLSDVLTFHVVPGTLYSAGLSDGQKIKSLQGSMLDIKVGSDGVLVNGAKVQQADLSTINGVIYVIDKLLLPPAVVFHFNNMKVVESPVIG
ncbi:transforming growth factor-beta-induced protein ig-h3-like [Plakobranchus ocellatus]|uniref:Transforming growth factor-beta-induced protein ig-h3-like n=1 Tax=Plakobranchus ocellatus TaxID=259542 RepID=A0AAV4DIA0_9GAST|nr:transforming growth factor-beta-induced protein ig-h3-like [Plakobranchus ocellatus]